MEPCKHNTMFKKIKAKPGTEKQIYDLTYEYLQ